MSEPDSWPRGGIWIIAGTSSTVDWQVAAAALAAVAGGRVAVVVVGAAGLPANPLLRDRVATWVEVRGGGADPARAEDAAALAAALGGGHALVLVAAPAGLLVPVGGDGWTVADLAVALSAPAVVVSESGPDAANHTTLALGALTGRGVPAVVIAIGDSDDDALPVALAGRIPGDPTRTRTPTSTGDSDEDEDPADTGPTDDFAEAARGWLNPLLHGGERRPAPGARAPTSGATVSGRRVVLGLLAVFAAAIVLDCGTALINRAETTSTSFRVTPTERVTPRARVTPREAAPMLGATIMPRPVTPTRQGTDVCPQNVAGVVPARADQATQRRVDAAWKRIEGWLARHAPKSHRALNPPASTALIDRTQRRMSVAFPADLVASLRRHDGVSAMGFDLPPFFVPQGADEIFEDWATTCRVLAGVESGYLDRWWDKGFVPFATAGDGGCLVVDQSPGGHGRVGEFYPEDGTSFERWPGSVTELLEQTARSLETGRPYNRYRPVVDAEGALDWEIL